MVSQAQHEAPPSGCISLNSSDKPCTRNYTRATSPESNTSLTARHEQEGTHRVGKERLRRRSNAYDSRPHPKPRSGRSSPMREVRTPKESAQVEDEEKEVAFNHWIANLHVSVPTADTRPPISAFTLAELECRQITSNPRLRHDVNFDRELHFRPNLDGSRGKEKLQQAQVYWTALEGELEAYGYLLSDENGVGFRWTPRWTAEFKRRSQRIPQVFRSVKEILLSLLPEPDQPRVVDMLDTELIMQQIERGMFDMNEFFCSLAKLLKVHCAPMRDNWLDRMVDIVTKDATSFSPKRIVSGLKELFGILEAMKLDIANHHIRYLRPSLLESTIGFEQAYYGQKIARGHVDTTVALAWLNHPKNNGSTQPGDLDTFLAAFISSMFPFSQVHHPFPPMFKLDHNRLYALCSDVCNALCIDVCCSALKTLMNTFERPVAEHAPAVAALPALLQTLVGARANEAQWASQVGNIAAELVRISMTEETFTVSDKTYTRLDVCDRIEEWLRTGTATQSQQFFEKSEALQQTVLLRVKAVVAAHIGMTPSSIFESLVAAPSRTTAATSANSKYFAASDVVACEAMRATANPRIDDLVRRAAHIAVLHWRVWAPLLYARQSDEPEELVGAQRLPTPPASPQV